MTDPDPRTRTRNRCLLTAATLLAATLAVGIATHGQALPGAVGLETVGLGGSNPAHASAGGVHFSGGLDRTAVLVGGDGLVRMELVMKADPRAQGAPVRLPTDLVVVLDRSGSMTGEKIRDARAAVHELIAKLDAEDRFALVAFSSSAEPAIPLAHATPNAVADWRARVDALAAGGGTYMAPALDLAFRTVDGARAAGRTPRVILISDGLAAEPHPTLRSLASRAAVGEYTLSAVGVGSDFDQELMALLADAGTGNYYYLEHASSLAGVFSDEFETARHTVATGLAVRIRPGPDVSVIDAAGYPLERAGDGALFRPGSLFAGQERRVWVTLRVPNGTEGEHALGSVALEFEQNGDAQRLALAALPRVAAVRQDEDFFAALDVEQWARSVAVEEFGALQRTVADYVKSGREDAAKAELKAFEERNRRINAVVASPAVAAQLDAAAELEESVEGAFRGADQARKQNLLGKSMHAESYDKRREGSRYR